MSQKFKRVIVISFILIAILIPLSVYANTTSNGGITLTYPDNSTECNPTFDFSTTGVDPSWPVTYAIFRSESGNLVQIGGESTSGDLNVSFTPEPLEAGESEIYAIFVAVSVPGQERPTKLAGKWRVDCGDEPGGGEGCTPGFWKNHTDVWPISTGDDFDTIFGRNAFTPDITMLEAVALKGGQLKALSRHAAAAYLNAFSPLVNYDMTTAEVIAAFQAAFDSGSYNTTKNEFEALNELGCPF